MDLEGMGPEQMPALPSSSEAPRHPTCNRTTARLAAKREEAGLSSLSTVNSGNAQRAASLMQALKAPATSIHTALSESPPSSTRKNDTATSDR